MKSDRNHEGYHDPTASQAIMRADRSRKGLLYNTVALTYQLQEARGFQKVRSRNQ